jgi:4-alpha-glucanotransferase
VVQRLQRLMKFPRRGGILLHPTSLPGRTGIGDFGTEAYRFIDFLEQSGNKLWQVLPLNPTGYGDSPFQCFSASAGNPLLISLETLVEQGVLSQADLQPQPSLANDKIDSELPSGCTTSSASIIFVGSRPTGKCPPRKAPQ